MTHMSKPTRDLQYISIWQYIDTANKYHDTILYLVNIDISKFAPLL